MCGFLVKECFSDVGTYSIPCIGFDFSIGPSGDVGCDCGVILIRKECEFLELGRSWCGWVSSMEVSDGV